MIEEQREYFHQDIKNGEKIPGTLECQHDWRLLLVLNTRFTNVSFSTSDFHIQFLQNLHILWVWDLLTFPKKLLLFANFLVRFCLIFVTDIWALLFLHLAVYQYLEIAKTNCLFPVTWSMFLIPFAWYVVISPPVKGHISNIFRCHSNVRYYGKTTKQVQQ